jgi:hypothetical protein
MRPILFSMLVLAACDDPRATTTVSLDTVGPPNLVAFRVGDGAWQTLPPNGNLYAIEVDEPYVVAVACNDFEDLYDTYLFARTPDDDPAVKAPCTGNGPALDAVVQGTLVQRGEVGVGFRSAGVNTGGAFDLDVSAGAHELVARSATKILIRDIEVTGTTVLPAPIDIDAEGTELVPGYTIANAAPDEYQFGAVQLFTEHQTYMILDYGEPEELLLAPDAILGVEDKQRVSMSASRDDFSRSVSIEDTRDAPARALTLPEHLSGVTLSELAGTITASWGALPEHDHLSLGIDQTKSSQWLYHTLEISRAYAQEMGTSITLDLAIPGFDPAGQVDMSAEYTRTFSAMMDRDGVTAVSSVAQVQNRPSPRRGASLRLAPAKPALRLRK